MAVLLLGTSLLGLPHQTAQTLAAKTEMPTTMRFSGAPFEITAAHRNLTYSPVNAGLRAKSTSDDKDDKDWCVDQVASFGTLASTECHEDGDCRTTTTPMTCATRISNLEDIKIEEVCTEFLKGVCPKACDACRCKDELHTGWVDSDHEPVECPQLKAWGYCETSLKATPLTCARTCGYCEVTPEDLGPGQPPPPPLNPLPMSPPPPPSMPPCSPTQPCVHRDPDYVAMHNAKRHLHKDTPDLIFDQQLADDAQAYAQLCPTGHNQHGVDLQAIGQGENLHWAWTSAIHGPEVHYQDAINDWYEEIKDYKWPTDYGDFHTDGEVVGHFTQLVWQNTYKVGCGSFTREVDANGKDVEGQEGCSNLVTGRGGRSNAIVCRYSNAGNFKNNYADPPVGYYNNVGECSWGFKDHDGAMEPVCADAPNEDAEHERAKEAAEGAAGHHHGEDDDA
jgi:hypothetical protein